MYTKLLLYGCDHLKTISLLKSIPIPMSPAPHAILRRRPLLGSRDTLGPQTWDFSMCPNKVAVVVFAIPTGIFGSGFEEMITARKQQKVEQEQQQLELEQQQGGNVQQNGTSAGVSAAYGGGSQAERPWFSFLDMQCAAGKVYRNVLVTVVVLDVCTFFATTLGYLQVRIGNDIVVV